MKQIAVISGKGGTGKTTITAAFADLIKSKVLADCDVDAANLHLILNPKIKEKHAFGASKVALVDREKCADCQECIKVCRFDAISGDYIIDPIFCEGCGVCYRVCPVSAIKFEKTISGQYFISDTRLGSMVHAKLGIAEENSGKLVTLVRKRAREIAQGGKLDYVLIDGPPGIGCPVIASITGVDIALAATEPTLSGIHDLERILHLTEHFRIKTLVCVNKYDINLENTAKIEKICREKSITIIGRIPYDSSVNKAVRQKETIMEYDPACEAAKEISKIWGRIRGAV